MPRRRARKTPSQEELLTKLASADPETRWLAAKDLATHGGRDAILPLERVALDDRESFQREGGYVDSTEYPFVAAFDALSGVYARHRPSAEDIARVRACFADLDVAPDDAERLATTLGNATLEMVASLLEHADPTIRLRATNAIGRVRGDINHALGVDDEEVRLAATRQDAYRPGLVRAAVARFHAEPSVRVRRGICDLWLRYRARMGGSLRSFELVDQLVDHDVELHRRVAEHVLETAHKKGTGWIDDPGGLRPIRAQLVTMLEPGHEPRPADALREVLALVERTLAPFER